MIDDERFQLAAQERAEHVNRTTFASPPEDDDTTRGPSIPTPHGAETSGGAVNLAEDF